MAARGREAETFMADRKAQSTSRTLAVAALFAVLSPMAALAQTVPMPPARPHAEPAVTGSVGTPANPRAQAQATQKQPPNPITNPFAALLGQSQSGGAAGGTLSADQKVIIQRVDTYLSNTQVLSGKFVQVGPDGRRSQGDFIIQKPGRVRFNYDPPTPIDIIADGKTVAVRDRKLATQDYYPLSQTPLRFLLANNVDLARDTNLVSVSADDTYVTVVVEEKNGVVGTSRLMIMFSAKDMQLKQWTVTDPQGYDTTVAVYNLDTSKKPNPGTFNIDYTNYHN
jgi:outer membrane lipoprotein-sorting protein